jgi:acetolactate synthase-1/2/3 large subunit
MAKVKKKTRTKTFKTSPKKAMNGAEVLIRCLEKLGVEYIFGLSGGSVIPIFDALVGSKIKLVLVRHEQGAAHIADGYARATGKPGVVLVTSGPGATNTVTGIMTANMDSIPMIVLSF